MVGVSHSALLETYATFYGQNLSLGSVYDVASYMATGLPASPTAGGTLAINGESLGSYDYVIKNGNQTLSSFTNSDWFTTTADSRSAWIVVNGNLSITSSQTLIPSNRKLFTVVYVAGDLSIGSGSAISMSSRGANHSATGSNITAAAIRIATGTFSGVTNPQVPAAGGAGAAGQGPDAPGATGTAGTNGGTGGGGSGGNSVSATSGAGAAGTSFSGGPAGGASIGAGNPGAANGGAGGAGAGGSFQSGGGAGNPGGAGFNGANAGANGTGGVLIIICRGAFSGAGAVTAAGALGGAPTVGARAGGSSGGGSVTILYGSDTSSITPTALGGASVSALGGQDGGAGGAGTARKLAL